MSNLPDPVTKPDLLNFEETEELWSSLGDDDKRARIVAMLDAVANFGVADAPEGRKDAYGDIIAAGETAAMRAQLLQKTTANSSCGLTVRTLWRMAGYKDEGGHLLDPPYVPGTVITRLVQYAEKNGAVTRPKPGDDVSPQQGDVLLIQGSGNVQHIFTVYCVEDDGATIKSVDGGQMNPDHSIDDGGCNCIQKRKRTLNKETLQFEGDAEHRVITVWIDVTKLPFTQPMIKLTRGDAAPEPADFY
jgi:hypothetical protein